MTTTEIPHGEDAHDHHICSPGTFAKVLGALLVLTIITVWVSRFDFGSANMLVAMAIAAVKASLVMAIFMHLKWDTTINNIFFLGSFFFLGLLFLFTLADWIGRSDLETMNGRRAPLERASEYTTPGTAEDRYFDRLEKKKPQR